MAESATVDLLLETIKQSKDLSMSSAYAFACGLLGAMANEEEVQWHINYLKENAK